VRARELVLALGLALLLFSETASFRRWELKRRALQLPRLAGLPAEEAERRGTLYEFDPAFGSFLEEVRQRVPPGASVAVSLPGTDRLYFYTAHYALAPRPVIEFHEGVKADFLAVYAGEGAAGSSLKALR
jgi:hypothetical protein